MSPAALDLACAIARARIASAIQTAALRHSIEIALDFERAHQRAHQRTRIRQRAHTGLPTLAAASYQVAAAVRAFGTSLASACTSLQRANAITRTLKDHP